MKLSYWLVRVLYEVVLLAVFTISPSGEIVRSLEHSLPALIPM